MRKLLIAMVTLLVAIVGFAQQSQKDVTGKVTDSNGQPLAGVTVSNKKSGVSAVTTANGT